MAFDAFLKIAGIAGESTDAKHRDWIEISHYDHEMSQKGAGSASSGGARSAQRCDHGVFKIDKTLDKASPKLALACCRGDHLGSVEIELCRATGEKQPYMSYKLADVIISSVLTGAAIDEAYDLPCEKVEFSYGKIEWTYTATDHKTGKAAGDVKAYWDLTANKGG